MVEKSRTFVNKRGLVPDTIVRVWDTQKDLVAARAYVAKHARDGTDFSELLEMLGIQIGVENDFGSSTITCNRSA